MKGKEKYVFGVVIALAVGFMGWSFIQGGSTESVSKPAPDFSLTSLEGETITLSDYEGEKPVILEFFATWCPNCKRSMPVLNRLYGKYSDDVEVIAINMQEREGVVESFIQSQRFDFPVVMDPMRKALRAYNVRYTNTHIFITADGVIQRVVSGDIRESHIKALIEASRDEA